MTVEPRGPVSRARRSFGGLLLGALALGACQFPDPPDVLEVDARIDAPPVDAPPTPPRLTAPQELHDFGPAVIGGTSAVFPIEVTNAGSEPSGPVTLVLTGATADDFAIVPTGDTSDCADRALAGGARCTAQVRYQPHANRAGEASLVIGAAPGGSIAIPVIGDALTPAHLTTTTSTADFGGAVLGAASEVFRITIQNDAEERTGVLGITKSGADAAEFAIVPMGATDCQGATLGQQGTCDVGVRFTPMVAGDNRTAAIAVTGDPGGTLAVTLVGDSLSPGDLRIEQPTAGASLDFGARDIGAGATSPVQLIRLRNGGGVPTGGLVVTLTGGGAASFQLPLDGCSGNPIAAGQSCDIQVRFNPAAVGTQPATVQIRDNASGATQAVTLTGTGTGNLALSKTGVGTVTSAPTGLNCPGGCAGQTASFSTTPVVLTATPDPGWVFDAWGGACAAAGSDPVCSVPIALAQTPVSATFRQLYTLTIATTGAGAVTSSPFGITCGSGGTDCSEAYLVGTNVQLTADPDPGWEVASWTGVGVSCPAAQHACAVTMSQARTVAVEFRPLRTLSVALLGSGSGTIAGAGINCQGNGTGVSAGVCTAQVIDGTPVTLTRSSATAAAGSQHAFGGWGGDCNGFGAAATCTFTIDGPKSVIATFTLQHRLTLTITSVGGGTGSLLANPGNLLCTAGTCSQYWNAGTTLTITASPATAIDVLQDVTGDCTASPCVIANLDAPKTVTATFLPSPGDLQVVLPSTGSLDFAPRDIGTTSAVQTARIRNSGGTAIGPLAVAITGGGDTSFAVATNGCGGVLAAGATCDVTVRFAPVAVGTLAAVLTVRDPASGATRGINLGGVGTGTLSVTRTGNGTVTSTPAGLTCGATCAASFAVAQVNLTAAADPGWVFDAWSGACAAAGTAPICTVGLTAATTTVGAVFRPLYTLGVTVTGMGSVTSSPGGIACGADCSESYVTGTPVTLTAEPSAGWEVAQWSGTGSTCSPGQRVCTTTMTAARAVTVEFRPLYTLAVTVGGSGSGAITGGGLDCRTGTTGTCAVSVIAGSSVTLTQTVGAPSTGSRNVFAGWGGDCAAAGAADTCTLTVDAVRAVTTGFTRQHLLTLAITSVSGGHGSLTASPGAFTCSSGTCSRYYDAGTALTVTATPATALDVLQGVSGDCTASPCGLAMDGPRAVTAAYLPAPGNLEVVSPASGGSLDFGARQVGTGAASTTQLIRIRNNGGTATGALATTVAGAGASAFTVVTDTCAGFMLGVAATCDVTVRFNPTAVGPQTAVVTVRDTVSGAARGVTTSGTGTGVVSVTRTGNGSITSTPAGLSCGATCDASFAAPPVTLTAVADPGWVFDRWDGACAGAGTLPTCALSLTGATTSASATFRPLYTLTVAITGNGTVASAPAGITCGADCSEDYLTGTTVTLTAEPVAGYEVFAWTGTGAACDPLQRTCNVSMTQARSVGVEFRLRRTLAVSIAGTGSGTVTGGGLNCRTGNLGTCAVQVFDGAAVTLSQALGTSSSGGRHVFTAWGGDCAAAGTATTCNLTVTAARNVTATFTQQWQLTLTVQSISGAAGSLTAGPPVSLPCSAGTCLQYVDAGTTFTATATPAAGTNELQGVTGACTASPCSVTMDAAKTITATFKRTAGALVVDAPTGALTFGTVPFGTAAAAQTITVRNSGGSPTNPLDTVVTGAATSSFTVVTDSCTGVSLAGGATCSLAVRFTPAALGDLSVVVSVRDLTAGIAVSVTATGVGQGSLTVTKSGGGTVASTVPTGLSCNAACATATASFTVGQVTLVATADPGWTFSGWTGACAGTATTCVATLGGATTSVGASFVRVYTLTVALTNGGSVTSAPTGISCGADCSEPYVDGTAVTLTAEPPAGWEVYAWTGAGPACTAGQRTCGVVMSLDRTIGVEFRRQYTLSVNVTGAGTGTVTGTGGISCRSGGVGTCSATLFVGSAVSLTAVADSGSLNSPYAFDAWTGACTGTGTCDLTLDAARTVTAAFKVRHRLTFTIDSIGGAQGSLTAAPGGFTCASATCSTFYDAGTALTVTAAATRAGIDVLQAVTGDCSATPCSLTMSGPRAITATVSPTPGSLSITAGASVDLGSWSIGTTAPTTASITVRNGGGSATGTLATVIGGAGAASYAIVSSGCTGALAAGASCTIVVRFTPAAAGSQGAILTVTDTGGSASVSASLNGVGTGGVTVNRTGSGTVASQPIGLSCGATCTATFSSSSVQLTATPDAGYVFTTWGGACASAGTASVCVLPITAASATVTATFTQVFTLTVAVTGGGVVTAAPAGITCGNSNTDCTEAYTTGTSVTLTATPDAGYDVASWTGTITACPAMQRTCAVPMSAARNVSVDLRPIPTVPQLARPLNGAYVGSALVVGTRRPKFVWRPSTVAGGGAITYDLQYGSDPTFTTGVTAVTGLTLTEHQPTGDLAVSTTAPVGRRYYWRVRACAAGVCSAYPTRYMVNVGRSDHDFNGDGYADLVVASNAKATIYFGGATLPGTTAQIPFAAGSLSIAVGDMNGDGFADLGLGIPADATVAAGAGKMAIYLGGSAFNTVVDLQLFGFAASDGMGTSATFGDFNSDGFDDLAVGTPYYSAPIGLGRVDVLNGASTLDATPDRTYFGTGGNDFGVALGAADSNGDGYKDLALGYSYFDGFLTSTDGKLYLGGATGPASNSSVNVGASASAGDLNGDGFEDFVYRGLAFVVALMSGPSGPVSAEFFNISASATGFSIGDVNRDGFDDLALGDGTHLWIYFGGAVFNSAQDLTYVGSGLAGTWVCGGGDFNGDGVADFVDGAPTEAGSVANSGRVHVFFGNAASLDAVPDLFLNGTVGGERFGWQCSL